MRPVCPRRMRVPWVRAESLSALNPVCPRRMRFASNAVRLPVSLRLSVSPVCPASFLCVRVESLRVESLSGLSPIRVESYPG